jgi:hypothetical protein
MALAERAAEHMIPLVTPRMKFLKALEEFKTCLTGRDKTDKAKGKRVVEKKRSAETSEQNGEEDLMQVFHYYYRCCNNTISLSLIIINISLVLFGNCHIGKRGQQPSHRLSLARLLCLVHRGTTGYLWWERGSCEEGTARERA